MRHGEAAQAALIERRPGVQADLLLCNRLRIGIISLMVKMQSFGEGKWTVQVTQLGRGQASTEPRLGNSETCFLAQDLSAHTHVHPLPEKSKTKHNPGLGNSEQ